MKSVTVQTHGKWILTGEHAVLRGAEALAFPLLTRPLKLQWTDAEPGIIGLKAHGNELTHVLPPVLERARRELGVSEVHGVGLYTISNELPLGGGLGASAALCAAVSRLFEEWGSLASSDVFEFARKLENLFHGESSGLDIAVALSPVPVLFRRGSLPMPFKPKWKPHYALEFSGTRGVTSECVARVYQLLQTDPVGMRKNDSAMGRATQIAYAALNSSESPDTFRALTCAVDLACDCFQKWGLIEPSLERTLKRLRDAGAVAVKPTGSGLGGHALGIWPESVPGKLTGLGSRN